MSEFRVEVVQLGKIGKHPNADSLSITQVLGEYPVIFRTGEFAEGELAVYVSIDAVVPADDPRWEFLAGHRRIKAKRLRGVFSMGLLTKAEPGWTLGQNVREELRIEKYESPLELAGKLGLGGENEPPQQFMPVFTDLEGLRRWPDTLIQGEEVHISEKLHGANGRWCFRDDRLWVGSHRCVKRENKANLWWHVADVFGLRERLSTARGYVIYGEVFGDVQDLKYGAKRGEVFLALFDALNIDRRQYLDVDDLHRLAQHLKLPVAPMLYRGPWHPDLRSLAEGQTFWPGADHVREGFVVRPVRERWDAYVGRVCFKMVGEGYYLRKSA